MNRILLAFAIFSTGAVGFLAAHHSTTQLARETSSNREAWLLQTQQLAAIHGEQAELAVRLREVKASLTQFQSVAENPLWSALRTNRADRLPPELRERVLEELGFNWQVSPDFIVVTKRTVADTTGWMLQGARLSDLAAVILAMTPEERGQVEAVLERARADFADWATAHVERKEPTADEVAHYVIPGDQTKISDKLAAGISATVGRDRWALMRRFVRGNWVFDNVGIGVDGANIIVRRESTRDGPRLKAEMQVFFGPGSYDFASGYLPELALPAAFRPVFPNGWADVARREGFELPPPP